MTNKITTACFTDIEDSSALAERLGHTIYSNLRREYFHVCETLANKNGGDNIKNTGDGHMMTFEDIESPFNFAAQLQEFYHPSPNYSESPFKLRIGLFCGVVQQEPKKKDAFGSGVNRASRVESNTPVGSVWVNEELVSYVSKVWGASSTGLFSDLGDIQVKKLGTIKMQSFNWRDYIDQHSAKGLSSLVLQHLNDATVVPFNLGLPDISAKLPVVWPVVPRGGINAIHCGQLIIMRLLAMLGAPINVLIADCGANNISREYSETFRRDIDSFATKMGMKDIRYYFMSDMFIPRCEGCDEFHRQFQKVISHLTFNELVDANNKAYEDSVKDEIKQGFVLDFLKPALTIASILHFSKLEHKKCIVVVGLDERIQWERAIDALPDTRDQFGVLFNPVLNLKEGAQVRQTELVTLYYSWQQLLDDMEKYDFVNWLTKLHLFLLCFPASSVDINGISIQPKDWKGNKNIEEKIDKQTMAKQVFDRILARPRTSDEHIYFMSSAS
jgi:class 3 adenylate cyclase